MYVRHRQLGSFRSWERVEVALGPGPTVFVGRNGEGKTNLVEAVGYLATMGSHRVAGDAPLVRQGATQAVIRAALRRQDRELLVEVEINPGRANRVRVNRAPLPRPRELLGLVKSVLFAPEDLVLVRGDPAERRRFLDDLLVLRSPRLAGVRSDYERVLKQRNALLKQAAAGPRAGRHDEHLESTLAVWDDQLVRFGTELVRARAALVTELQPLLGQAYAAVAKDADRNDASLRYQPSVGPETDAFAQALAGRRREELQRGLTLVGPHRDELALAVGTMPVKGYASHGESWSFALALRLSSYDLLKGGGDDPVLVLDDVFAELDGDRRDRLADLVAGAEQVLV